MSAELDPIPGAAARLGAAVARVWRALRETITPMGWVLVILLLGGLAAGFAFGLVEALVAAVIAGLLLLFSVPFLLGAARYDIRFTLDRDRVVAGSEVSADVTVRNAGRRLALPAVLDIPIGSGLVESLVPLLGAGAEHADTITIDAPRRGVIPIGPMMISRGDPVGVLRRDLAWPQTEIVYVHPVTVPLPPSSAGFVKDVEGQPTRRIVDSDLAFHAIRDYHPGDSRRHIHWKSTAKVGSLMVRQFEESRRARIAVVLDVFEDAYAEEDEFELGVSAAASIALQAVRDDRDVLMVASEVSARGTATIASLPTTTPKALLDASCSIRLDAGAQRLEAVTRLAAQTFPELSIAFLVTGSRIAVDRLRRAVYALPSTASAVVVRVEPGAEPAFRTTSDFTMLTVGVLDDLAHLIARGALE